VEQWLKSITIESKQRLLPLVLGWVTTQVRSVQNLTTHTSVPTNRLNLKVPALPTNDLNQQSLKKKKKKNNIRELIQIILAQIYCWQI